MTVVEWLVDKLDLNVFESDEEVANVIEQAKEMEHEQMEITWNNAIDAELKDKWQSFDQFHNETFKSE